MPARFGRTVSVVTGVKASERVTLKQLLQSYVEQGLSTTLPASLVARSAAALPRLEGPLAMASEQLSNASLFELLEP